ncbi:MAG TPA: hypothetical protein VJ960_10125, partial [Oceanipulchritudo sp.]|nr:hypothetical protein [Oceanipulchritudo sp.]
MRHCITFLTLISLICFTGLTTAEAKNHSGTSPLEGVWEVIPELSPGVDRHSRRLKVEIRMDGDQVTLKKTWGRRGGRSEELELVADGKARTFPVESRFSLTTVYSALHARAGDERTIAASLEDSGRQLVLELEYPVDVAQGRAVLKERQIFRANTVEPMLHYTI